MPHAITSTIFPPTMFQGLEHILRENHPLAGHTWYRIGGPARYFAEPATEDQLSQLLSRCADAAVPVYFLGLGANVLVGDAGVDGVVIHLGHDYWTHAEVQGNRVVCGAGKDVQKLVLQACRAGLAGIECMAGIPGTVGGAVKMNAGGKFGDFGTSVVELRLMDPHGNVVSYSRDQIQFAYRHAHLPAPYVLGATLELEPQDPNEISKRTKEIWMYKRNSQPLNAKSAGCVFKNPDPAVSSNRSAGALIDQAGLKGLRFGAAEVSPLHANFFVAHPGCRADDVLTLIDTVKEKVAATFGVQLENELKVWR
jgi:UDP-N-acetylmuramate dehydrogenase